MRREPPAWWYRDTLGWEAVALSPLAALVDAAGAFRAWRAKPYRAPVPVICIGNFTAGGAGKTPLALAVAQRLQARGHVPGFLTRGYGGSARGPLWVLPGTSSAVTGDEPLLLVRTAATMLARDRAAGARAMTGPAADVPGGSPVDVIVMDDGLQNPSLTKDLSLVVVDGTAGIGNGRVLPAGPLRQSLARQRRHTDAVVVVGELPPKVAALMQSFRCPVLRARLSPADGGWLAGARVAAFAGIGRPEKFFQTLREAGADLAVTVPFPDHHPFTAAECAGLLASAQAAGAQLVTTEKDWLRLASTGAHASLKQAARPLPVTLEFAADDLAILDGLLTAALANRPARDGRHQSS